MISFVSATAILVTVNFLLTSAFPSRSLPTGTFENKNINDWISEKLAARDGWSASGDVRRTSEKMKEDLPLRSQSPNDPSPVKRHGSVVLLQQQQDELRQFIHQLLLHRSQKTKPNAMPGNQQQQEKRKDDVTMRKRNKDGAWVWVPAQGMIYVSGEMSDDGNPLNNKALRYGR